jgi:hypothetical protein
MTEEQSMRSKRSAATALALFVALSLTACGEQARDAVEKAITEAREEMHEEPIDLGRDGVDDEVQLMPGGDLLINGKAVPMDARQREAALAYREKLLAVADAGLMVGQQSAALGGEAAALALGALFDGGDLDAEEAERKFEAEAGKIRTAALALCRSARALEIEQARFAEVLPEFAPYAQQIDIDADCEDADDEPSETDRNGS